MTTIQNIVDFLQQSAPFSLQESYDNSGLLVGDPDREVTGIVVALDCTEAVIAEAIVHGANVVLTHHPIIFKGLKRLTGSNYVERTVIKAIENKVALISFHTNFDNVLHGVNDVICEKLGLVNRRILAQKSGLLSKLVVFVPQTHTELVQKALFAGGAGEIGNYDSCSFYSPGGSTFRPLEGADPFIGKIGQQEQVKEDRVEVLVSNDRLSGVLKEMLEAHPYEEVAYDIIPLTNISQDIGSGMVGELEKTMDTMDFLLLLKQTFGCGIIRHTAITSPTISRVAVCGGAGGFLLGDAIRAKADIFITADYKYHEFFDADQRILIADIGHFESEQFTSERLVQLLLKKFTTFAVRLTNVNTNPINYL